jgi:thiosulfate/3-mercaptopyruvate sulfurtransferase
MKFICARIVLTAAFLILFTCLIVVDGRFICFAGVGSSTPAPASSRITEPQAAGPQQIQPEELVSILKSPKGPKPLIIQVGFRVFYLQAHIPGSEYIGPASSPEGIRKLHNRVESLPRTQFIVLYCGCCPWNQCPNIEPSYQELRDMGFKDVKVLYIAHNFGKDWAEKGYPVAREE